MYDLNTIFIIVTIPKNETKRHEKKEKKIAAHINVELVNQLQATMC